MRFKYSEQFFPVALILSVKISPLGGSSNRDVSAKIDTGADITVVPKELVKQLGLPPRGVIYAKGAFDTQAKAQPTFFITLSINDVFSFEVEVLSSERNNLLVGRDVLNQIILQANGPAKFFEITK
jgi:predicted aspartyl protease